MNTAQTTEHAAPIAATTAPTTSATQPNRIETYASKAPYPDRSQCCPSQPPMGYIPVSVQYVGRHGSRLLASKKYDDLLAQLLQKATEKNAITEAGKQLLLDIARLTQVHETGGYGNLTQRGRNELQNIARRTNKRLHPLFTQDNSPHIVFRSSGQTRATESGENYLTGLIGYDQYQDRTSLQKPIEDLDRLYFHKRDEAYLEYKNSDPALKNTLTAAHTEPHIQKTALNLMKRYVSEEFLHQLDTKKISFHDSAKGKYQLRSSVEAAVYLYQLYIIAPLLSEDEEINFDHYVETAEAEIFAYLADTTNFYVKGPAFYGQDITYRMSRPLLADLLEELTKIQADHTYNTSTLRFAHAETLIPLSVLLQLPGNTKQATETEPYRYENNPWRGALHTPMASNLQWDIYRHQDNPEDVIVRMLFNEIETAFPQPCEPITPGSTFYSAETLLSGLAHLAEH